MTLEEAIQAADEVLLTQTGDLLTDIQRMILRESLAGKSYERMEGYSTQHIKNEGNKLWKLLSEALGERVSKKNFKGALEKQLKSGSIVPKPPKPSNYDEQTWVGREAMVNELLSRLQGQTSVLWITGISGIGKTALGECLASQAWESDPSFQWIYLEILEGQSTDFVSVAADLLIKMGDRDLDPQERSNPEQVAKRLLQKLQTHSYWIQLDALERLLKPEQPTQFVDSYWTIFLQRCLTQSNLVSRLVLTAQAFPTELVEFSDRYPNVWIEIRLGGLLEVDQQLEFFAKRGLIIETPNRESLTHIAQIYEGHPLVLKVIAEDILKGFAGNVLHYWRVYQREFEQVARELQDARLDETEYNEVLDHKVRERIKRALEQLPADALNLLCRSAVFRRPVPKKFWLAMIGDRSTQQKKAAYRLLDDRTLVEQEGGHQGQLLIRQHNLVREIAYSLLLNSPIEWKVAENMAATCWLIHYEPEINDSKLEKVRGYLEAFYHNCNIQAWSVVQKIFLYSLNTPTSDQLHYQLGVWGYYQEQIQLYKKFLELATFFGDAYWVGKALGGLGNYYYSIGNYFEAIQYFKEQLSNTQKNKDRKGEGEAFGSLCNVYQSIGRYPEALDCCQQSSDILRESSSSIEEARMLGNLANIYLRLRKYEKAIKCYGQSLEIILKFDKFTGELLSDKAYIFTNLGSAHLGLKEHSKAEEFYRKALLIANKIEDIQLQAALLSEFGNLYEYVENYPQAKIYFQRRLDSAKEISDLFGEAYALHHLGIISSKLENFSKALNYLYEARLVCVKTGSASYEAEILRDTAILNHFLENMDVAFQACNQALALASELDILLVEECRQLKEELERCGGDKDEPAR